MFDNNLFIEDAGIESSNYQETDWTEKDMPDLFGDNEDIDNDDIADESVELSEEEITDLFDINDEEEIDISDLDLDFLEDIDLSEIEDEYDNYDDANEASKLSKSQKTILKIAKSKPVLIANDIVIGTVGRAVSATNYLLYHKKYEKYVELCKKYPDNLEYKKKKQQLYVLMTLGEHAWKVNHRNLTESKSKANESALFINLEPAMEADALTTGLNNLAKVDGTAEEENNPDDGDIGDNTDTTDKPMAPAPTNTNLAEQTDQQMQDDGQETSADTDLDAMGADMGAGDDPNATAGGDMGATTTPEDDGQDTLDDPLKNIETKRAYKDKFVYLYNIINDSLKTMESFTPEYRSKICNEYYAVRTNLTKLKTIIYDICINKISKMTVDEVLRKYTLANHIYDLSSRQLKEFFVAYEKEKSKEEKKVKTSVISQSEKKRKNKLHLK